MAQAVTTSIRLPVSLRRQLEKVSRLKNEGKNFVIIEALIGYFKQIEKAKLIKEARRQSLLASKKNEGDVAIWEENLDFEDWKN